MASFLSESEQHTIVIQRELDVKGRKSWTLSHLKIMIEMLVNGTPPTDVVNNLEITIRLIFLKVEIIGLPNIDHLRKCGILFEHLDKH